MSDSKGFKLINKDFFEAINSLPEESIDLVFADPPYFLSNGGFTVRSGKQVSVNKGKWDEATSRTESQEFHRNWIQKVRRVMAPDASIVITGTHHSIFQCAAELERSGFRLLNDIVWFKPNGAPNLSRRRLAASHEMILWACKSNDSKFVFNYEDLRDGDYPGDGIKRIGKQMRSVWWIPTTPKREKTFGQHPTQKPLDLMRRIIVGFSAGGSNVLDPFMGSGTTGVACKELGRNFTGIEMNQQYFEIAKTRMGA